MPGSKIRADPHIFAHSCRAFPPSCATVISRCSAADKLEDGGLPFAAGVLLERARECGRLAGGAGSCVKAAVAYRSGESLQLQDAICNRNVHRETVCKLAMVLWRITDSSQKSPGTLHNEHWGRVPLRASLCSGPASIVCDRPTTKKQLRYGISGEPTVARPSPSGSLEPSNTVDGCHKNGWAGFLYEYALST